MHCSYCSRLLQTTTGASNNGNNNIFCDDCRTLTSDQYTNLSVQALQAGHLDISATELKALSGNDYDDSSADEQDYYAFEEWAIY